MNILTDRKELLVIRAELKRQNKKVVFTNGCFDILHPGHVDYLNKAKQCGDILIVALNSDESVKRIKGEKRPILKLAERAYLIGNLKAVDFVTYFEEDTPENIIAELIPDYLIKGEDWDIDKIIGRNIVENNGGEVKRIKFVTDRSSTDIIRTIIERYK
ncbi:MAG: D-glycero-beta-D-manno-heptose 1-phosphate adenylyltransferase [Ignavibacteriales bacterium]|jgi:D-beta-D-heptose 7-phosphate kinase/D-beta-D-heptose 1-phosphate adenosyltransferase|nr:MAG: D-glycero-beta-D-manno-heptose 1-phosphate adenylyltransferase [Ignavibacteriales bacterium]